MPGEASLLDQLLAASPDAVLLVDEDGRITRAWGATERVFGYAPDELVGESIELLVPPAERARHVQHRTSFAGEGKQRPMGSGLTVDGLRRDGSHVPLDIKLTPVQVDGRRLFAAFARDVTHLAETQRLLMDRTRALEALDQEKNRVLGVAAHDLRNPLAALKGFTDLLEAGIFGDLEARAPGLVGRVARSVDYMSRLVDGLVDFSVIESGHISLDREPTDLGALVDGAVAVERLAARRREIDLQVELGADLGQVDVDPAKIEQVVHNLVGNAIRFTPDGSQVRVKAWREAGHVLLQVDDDGPGIAVDQPETLFQPFTRGRGAVASGHKGAGLGLAIVHRIVTGHGGHITVDSPPGRGACFTVRLPAS